MLTVSVFSEPPCKGPFQNQTNNSFSLLIEDEHDPDDDTEEEAPVLGTELTLGKFSFKHTKKGMIAHFHIC